MFDLNQGIFSWEDLKRKQENSKPLGSNIASSPAEAPTPVAVNDPVVNQLQTMAINKGITATGEAGKAGYDAFKAAKAAAPLSASIAPSATTTALQGANLIPAMSVAPTATTATTTALQGANLIPAMSTAATTAAPLAATTGTSTALGAGLNAAGSTMLSALGPIGAALAAGFLLKKLF